MTVYVYRNLRRGGYSIMHKGRVIEHRQSLTLSPASFIVSPAGRARVLREGRKNVHAFVKGELEGRQDAAVRLDEAEKLGFMKAEKVTYNPYKAGSFMSGGEPVKGAKAVLLNEQGITAFNIER